MPSEGRARGTDLRLVRLLKRPGDCEDTSNQDGAALSLNLRCRLSDQVYAIPQRELAADTPLPNQSSDRRYAAAAGEHLWVKLTDRETFFSEERLRRWPCAQAQK